MPLSFAEFVERWKAVTLTERAAAQSHFIDLCEVLGQLHPAADQTSESFMFEQPVSKLHGDEGFQAQKTTKWVSRLNLTPILTTDLVPQLAVSWMKSGLCFSTISKRSPASSSAQLRGFSGRFSAILRGIAPIKVHLSLSMLASTAPIRRCIEQGVFNRRLVHWRRSNVRKSQLVCLGRRSLGLEEWTPVAFLMGPAALLNKLACEVKGIPVLIEQCSIFGSWIHRPE
jgi:hypothetical protein